MPPRIPVRFPWTSSRSTIPPTTTNGSLLLRSGFSSSPTSLALGPESPNYIEVPKTVQPTYPPKPIVKGHLPIPRDVFKTRSAKPKESDAFIDASTKSPKKQKVPGPYTKDADYRLYKQRLAESRKEALRTGVKELHERKVRMEASHLSKIQKIGAFRRKVAMAPPREVDVLTQTSMTKGMRDFLADKLPFSSKANISQGRRDAYGRRMEKQQAIREARLHDLYTNARTFIVNEEQLDEAIESAFGTETEPMGWDVRGIMVPNGEGHSPFHGPTPESVGDMLEKLRGGEGVGLAKERVKKLAEELTGGKM